MDLCSSKAMYRHRVADMRLISLQCEGKLDWCLSVRYTYDKLTGAIGCNQEADINCLLVRYGMTSENDCKLPMHPGSNLDVLPASDLPDKNVVYAYANILLGLVEKCQKLIHEFD